MRAVQLAPDGLQEVWWRKINTKTIQAKDINAQNTVFFSRMPARPLNYSAFYVIPLKNEGQLEGWFWHNLHLSFSA